MHPIRGTGTSCTYRDDSAYINIAVAIVQLRRKKNIEKHNINIIMTTARVSMQVFWDA